MLTCIACSKHLGPEEDDVAIGAATPSAGRGIKDLTAQIKEMALKATGAYRHCKPCGGAPEDGRRHHHGDYVCSEAASGSDWKTGGSAAWTPRTATSPLMGREIKEISSGERTPSVSGWTEASSAAASTFLEDGEEEEPKEWVAQVEPGILITFLSLPHGGNDLKRIRFSREMFNKWQAQRWWAENYDKVVELYNVHRFNRHAAMPLPTPPRSEDESSKDTPVTPPLSKERLPRNLCLTGDGGMGYSSSDSLEQHSGYKYHGHHHHTRHACRYYDSGGLTSTPKLSSISGSITETSSMNDDASRRTSSSAGELDPYGELSASVSNASDLEREWVEEDEPGVYITIRELPGGIRELRRVRFSRERFGEMHARLWWEENRARIQEQYLR
ncbi:hypothetical protein OPV22_013150 [Ensete ventricosum]|uniref:BRX domain-containing protein n=1 Tax=Ensete ventricosum TaxID=4639 RepID=A0AAV8R075_ENSVE|nr:hypothetical protein OPV22_013150 [Ensete ventricosum]